MKNKKMINAVFVIIAILLVGLLSCKKQHVHQWVEANCVTPKRCTECGETEGDPLGHTIETIELEPTCTTNGSVYTICSVCGEKNILSVITSLGHSYGEWKVVLEPTYETEGKKTRTCARCNVVEEETIPMLNNTDKINEVISKLKMVEATSENLNLPTLIDGVTITWVSARPTILSNTGVINRGAKDTNVSILATFTYEGTSVQKCGIEANIIENHDEPRGVSRFLPEYARNPLGTKMLGTVSVLLRGIPFIYQGQEIGMQNAVWNDVKEYNDINTIDQYNLAISAGLSDKEALAVCSKMSRDNARTPVQWSDSDNAGFTTGTPWLKVNSNYKDINVQNQENDPDSVLNYYRKLVATRKSPEYKEVFTYGVFEPAYEDTEYVMAYYRVSDNQRILVAANFGKDAKTIELNFPVKKVVLSNVGRKEINEVSLKLDSCEVIVIECGE